MEINMDTIPIYIINLDRRPDRWENTKNQMKIFNDNYIRFSAVDTNNTIGCALSYYKLLEEHKDIDYIMILQDDVQFLDYSKEVFSNTLKEVPNDWDVILSGVHYGKYRSKITSNVVELSDFSGLQMAIIKPRILPLLKKSYRCEFYSGPEKEVAACLSKGIPSGSPVVPLLENIYLRELDKELGAVGGTFYARYGDDFIFLTSDNLVAQNAIERINQVITKLKLKISQKKIKNYVLGATKKYSDFQRREFFEWIGITFYQSGMYSFRPKHKEEYKKKFRQETGNITHHLSKSGLESSQIAKCLNIGFNEINDLKKIPDVQKLIVLRTHIQNTKDLDKDSREFLLRTMCKTLKITKRQAWKLFRTMKLHSLEYQRRKLKCNKVA